MLYAYARVSTDEQSDSIVSQVVRLNEFCEQYAKQTGTEFAAMFVDEDVSAFTTDLKNRPSGKRLWDTVGPGDVVVVTAQDRLFRDPLDALKTFKTWKGIDVTLFDLGKGRAIDTCDDQTMFELMAVLSGSESRKNGERRRNINKTLKKSGKCYSFTCPWGWTRKDVDGEFTYVEDVAERERAKEAIAMRKLGMTYPDIAYKWSKKGYRKTTRGGELKWYTRIDIRSLCLAMGEKFPKIPRDSWKSSLLARMRCAEVSGESQPTSAG